MCPDVSSCVQMCPDVSELSLTVDVSLSFLNVTGGLKLDLYIYTRLPKIKKIFPNISALLPVQDVSEC